MFAGFPSDWEILCALGWPWLLLLICIALPALMWVAEWDAKRRRKARENPHEPR